MVGTTGVKSTKRRGNEVRKRSSHPGEMPSFGVPLSGASVERRTECTVTNALLDTEQQVWLSYTWTKGG